MAAVPLNTSNGTNNGAEVNGPYTVANAAVQQGKIAISPDDGHVFVALGTGGTIAVPFIASVAAGSSPFGSTAQTVPVAHTGGARSPWPWIPAALCFTSANRWATPPAPPAACACLPSVRWAVRWSRLPARPSPAAARLPTPSCPRATEVYVANGTGPTTAGNITTFNLTSSSGAYTIAAAGTTAAASGIQPFSLAEDSDGNFVLAVSEVGDPFFSSYTFDTTTIGQLDVQITASTGTAPLAVVAAP